MAELKPKTNIAFGTDGWRAVMNHEFIFENVALVAQAIADHVNGRGEGGNPARGRNKAAGTIERRKHIPVQADVRRHRVSRKREYGRAARSDAEPKGLPRPLRNAVKHIPDPLFFELVGQVVEFPL